ncbi:preprotein translocase subunit SecA [Mesomycoplasma molare]|uniref:Protein translocase subunit SecA n=1 Tax=Mesomycoplasma molare TaxID=171288 RepID=A0ABY5TZF8_9BACT|nr:preprotein translocase subunit SecA [Mesomycoplasma molare]
MKRIKHFFNTSAEMKLAKKLLKEINSIRSKYSSMSDFDLQSQTKLFKERLKNGETLEDIRVEAFAAIREATRRVLNKFPYDVQILGGLILDMGSIAEMKTGEGKTITSIAPAYLNALEGKGVIISTVNEYLSERDAEEMGRVHNWMGLSVGINKAQMDKISKRQAYNSDITYSVHSELGFDYLRDNMVFDKSQKVQRGLNYILIDEVDSILIDEAKTPLIISGGEKHSLNNYLPADQFVRTLASEDYEIDLESKAIKLTESGINKANNFFNLENLYHIQNSHLVHSIQNALRAHKIMKKDVEYIIRDGKIELVDTFTGRIMEGRSYSEGLQQAIQAKEMIEIEPETKTMATITYQNLFRMFKKLSGMTGTAKTEEQEFIDIYNMRVNVIDTNRPIIRKDDEDLIFSSFKAKYKAIVNEIKEKHKLGQPILVGTSQVDESEYIHSLLQKEGIPHTVLNAKQNEQEAEIIAKAGHVGSVTIATNMAGRGTDIKPTEEALEKGGLYVLGTDKSESRRIDNQLKGRSGRQGDIGYSRFFLSIDDQLITRFAHYDQIKEAFGSESEEPIKEKSIYKFFKRAQKKIEGLNYDNRKNVLNFDDVIRQQRDLVYTQRDIVLETETLDHYIEKIFSRAINNFINFEQILKPNKEINYSYLTDFLNENFSRISKVFFTYEEISQYHFEDLIEYINEKLKKTYFDVIRVNLKENLKEDEKVLNEERRIILSALDHKWQNHIDILDRLRSSANLVQYSQKNPFQIFTEEATKKFEVFINESADQIIVALFNNYNGRKIEYFDVQLSNGEFITLNKDMNEFQIQQIIEKEEQRIQLEREANEYVRIELVDGSILSLSKTTPEETIKKIVNEHNARILESQNKSIETQKDEN